MKNTKEKFIDKTLEFWQSKASRPLTREDAREIAENLVGFFRILQEWDREEQAKKFS